MCSGLTRTSGGGPPKGRGGIGGFANAVASGAGRFASGARGTPRNSISIDGRRTRASNSASARRADALHARRTHQRLRPTSQTFSTVNTFVRFPSTDDQSRFVFIHNTLCHFRDARAGWGSPCDAPRASRRRRSARPPRRSSGVRCVTLWRTATRRAGRDTSRDIARGAGSLVSRGVGTRPRTRARRRSPRTETSASTPRTSRDTLPRVDGNSRTRARRFARARYPRRSSTTTTTPRRTSSSAGPSAKKKNPPPSRARTRARALGTNPRAADGDRPRYTIRESEGVEPRRRDDDTILPPSARRADMSDFRQTTRAPLAATKRLILFHRLSHPLSFRRRASRGILTPRRVSSTSRRGARRRCSDRAWPP